MASWPEGLMCTLKLNHRLVGRCLLLTLSSKLFLGSPVEEEGRKKALLNPKTTVGVCMNRSRELGVSVR